MSDMKLVVAGAGGRMGRTLIKAIAETPGLAVVGALEGAGSPLLGQDSGLLAGLGVFAIPGIGPVVGAGWLATTLVGAAAGGVTGGIIGAMTDAGVDEADAHVYAEGVRRGGTLVTARVDESEADAATAILGQSNAVDVGMRRSEYQEDGWAGFDPLADPWDDDAMDGDREKIVTPPLPR